MWIAVAESQTVTANNSLSGACSVDLQLTGELLSMAAADASDNMRWFNFDKLFPYNQLGKYSSIHYLHRFHLNPY